MPLAGLTLLVLLDHDDVPVVVLLLLLPAGVVRVDDLPGLVKRLLNDLEVLGILG